MSHFAEQVERQSASLKFRGYDGLYWRGDGGETCGCGELRTGCRPARETDGLFYPTLRRNVKSDAR